jgi:hypothetical protein
MVGKRNHTGGATSGRKGARAITALAPVFALAFVFTVAAPVGFDSGFAEKSALAQGKSGERGASGNHRGGKVAAPIAEEEAAAIEMESFGLDAESFGLDADGSEVAADMPLLPGDANAGKNQVIRELAGLPEDSALSEEEELEAIRSGWGTWRTADGPETVTSQ